MVPTAAVALAACGDSHERTKTTHAGTTTETAAAGTGSPARRALATARYVVVDVNNPEYFRVTIYDLRRSTRSMISLDPPAR